MFVQAEPVPMFPDMSANVAKMIADKKAEADARAAQIAEGSSIVESSTAPVQSVPTASQTVSAPSGDIRVSIVKWATVYGVDTGWLLRVVNCESGFNQGATNYGYSAGGGHPHGIAQFLPQTFYGNGGVDYESYDDQARVMAKMFSEGQSGQWACK